MKQILLPVIILFTLTESIFSQNFVYNEKFGEEGIYIFSDGPAKDEIVDLEILSDGKILILGSTDFDPDEGGNSRIVVVKLTKEGKLDSSFGVAGKIYIDTPSKSDIPYALSVQNDGKILIAGQIRPDFDGVVYRLNSNGTADNSFGVGGKANFNIRFTTYRNIIVQPNGKIVVSGDALISSRFNYFIGRFNSNGIPDTSFNKTGFNTFRTSTQSTEEDDNAGIGLAIQNDGKILTCGYNEKGDGTIARLTTDGKLDPSFGVSNLGYGIFPDFISTSIIQHQDKIVISGSYNKNGTNSDKVGINRLLMNGNFDPSFNGFGIGLYGASTVPGFKSDIIIFNNKYLVSYLDELYTIDFKGIEDDVNSLESSSFISIGLKSSGSIIKFYGTFSISFSLSDGVVISIEDRTVVSVEDEIFNTQIKVYPNPVSNILKVELDNQVLGEVKYELFNTIGQQMTYGVLDNSLNQINVSAFPKGIYYLQIFYDNRVSSKKIVIGR